MARRTRKAPKQEPVTAEAVAEATAETPTEQPSTADIMRRIQEEFANRPEPRRVSIQEIFEQSVALVASATGRRVLRVSENTAVKLYELALMWALNNRSGAPSHEIIPDLPPTNPAGDGEGDEEPAELPEPNETIEASPDQSDPEE